MTYWFDAEPEGEPYTVAVHLAGHLRGRHPEAGGIFNTVTTVDPVVPGTGRLAVTTRILGLQQGTWDVTATPVQRTPDGTTTDWTPIVGPRLPSGTASGATLFQPVAKVLAPGAHLGVWPALVTTGAVLALVIQVILAARLGLSVQRLLPVSLAACLLGLIGARAYFLATHRHQRWNAIAPGMSVQGFMIASVIAIVVGAAVTGLPPGTALDVTTPGLLLGMTVGRLGCLLGGCCTGRPTSSRWGLWSSDRRIGVRRIPVQLLESSLAGLLAGLTLLAVAAFGSSADGIIFVAGVATYTAGRQMLFPLRSIRRDTRYGRVVTLVLALTIAIAATATMLR